jgi:hypothetical protein
MPREVQERGASATARRCSYCGFVWFEGAERIPAGYFDSMGAPGFTAVPTTHKVR